MMNPRFTQLDDWLQWLEDKANQLKQYKLSLDHLLPIAKKLSLTDFDIPVIMVAGTNGKGSTVAMLESVYQAAGYHTAIYTSPHFIEFTERLQIDGKQLSKSVWSDSFAFIDESRGDTELSYFEFSVLAALWLIKQRISQLDVIILEIGLGGRLDAVNIVNADVAVITTIDFDHMEYLGNTRDAIAREKAGIMRENRSVVCGDFEPPQSLFEIAKQLHAPMSCQSTDFYYQSSSHDWSWHNNDWSFEKLPLLSLPMQNASTVLQVIYLLRNRLPVEKATISSGLAQAKVTGRMQRISVKPEVILDVAHNPHAARYLAEQLPKQRYNQGRVFAVIGMKADKDIPGTLEAMKPIVDQWYVVSLQGYRGANAEELLQYLNENTASRFDTAIEGYRQALTDASDNDTIVVFGSFFTVAPILEIVNDRIQTTTTAATVV